MRRPPFVLVLALVGAVVSCTSAPQTSAPKSPAAPVTTAQVKPGTASKTGGVPLRHTKADAEFMQGMIGHHQQAIEMTALLYTRTQRDDMKLLAQRIDVSQTDEMKMMRRWLETRGESVPSEHAMHMEGAHLMPGMLTPPQMERLSAAKGDEFDTLFLEAMIYHHMGALTMVEELLKAPGAAQDSEIFDFVSHVDTDQRMEISRMRGMLKGKQ